MPEAILCPKCGKTFPFQAALAGKRVKCNACGHVFSVAAPATPPAGDSSKKTPKAPPPEAIPVAQIVSVTPSPQPPQPPPPPVSRPRPLDDLPSSPEFDTAGVRLPSAAALKSKRRAAASFSAGGSRLADFIMVHPLMVAVVAVAVISAVVLAILAHAIYAIVLLAVGLAVAATGLLPYPAANESRCGLLFAIIALLCVVASFVRTACIVGPARLFPTTGRTAALVGYYTGFLIGFGCIGLVILLIALVLRRFGFFRPAACGYLAYAVFVSIVGIAVMNRPVQVGIPPWHQQASSGPQPTDSGATVAEVPPQPPEGPQTLWREFRSEQHCFTAEFPEQVRMIHPPGADNADVFVAELGEAVYFVISISTEGSRKTDAEILDALQVGRPFGNGGSVSEIGPASLRDARMGRTFLAEDAAKGTVFEGRVFVANNRMYKVMVGTSARRKGAPETRKFLESFRLLKPASSPPIAQTEAESSARPPAPPMASIVNPFEDPSNLVSEPRADVDEIDSALADLKSASRSRVMAALGRLARIAVVAERREEVVMSAARLLADPNESTRKAALDVVVVWQAGEVIPLLIAMLDSEDSSTRWDALGFLGHMKDPRVIDAVALHWATKKDQVRAAQTLIAIGPAAEENVLKHLDSKDPEIVAGACDILAKIGTKKSVPRLTVLIRSQDILVRTAAQRAGRAIVAAGRSPESPIAAVAADFSANAAAVDSGASGEAAGNTTTPAATDGAIARLLADLKGDDETRCKAAAEELAGMEPPQQGREEVAKALTTLLLDRDETVRTAALKALGKWHVPQSIAEMAARLDDDSFQVRKAAFNALGSTKDPAAADVLAKRLDGNSAGDAARNLQAIGPIAEDAVLKCLDDSRPQVLILACKTLGEIGTEKSAAKLETLGDHADFSVSTAASVAVSKIRSRPIVP